MRFLYDGLLLRHQWHLVIVQMNDRFGPTADCSNSVRSLVEITNVQDWRSIHVLCIH